MPVAILTLPVVSPTGFSVRSLWALADFSDWSSRFTVRVSFLPFVRFVFLDLITYQSDGKGADRPTSDTDEFAVANKRRVVQFIREWQQIVGTVFHDDPTLKSFIEVRRFITIVNFFVGKPQIYDW